MTDSGRPLPRPRWGTQASFVHRGDPPYELFMLLLVGCGLASLAEQASLSRLLEAYALSWGLVVLYALPVALLVYRLDLFEREPNSLLVAAFVWGAVIAPPLAGAANAAWLSVFGKVAPDLASQWGPAVVAPAVEETLKLAGVVSIFLIARREFDGMLDGFVYGAMVGLGFTVVEDVGYFMRAAAAIPGSQLAVGAVLDTFVVRIVGGGLYGHVLFSGLAGLGFACLVGRARASLRRRFAVAALATLAAFLGHAVWNAPVLQSVLQTAGGRPTALQWIVYGAIKGGPFLLLLGLLLGFATRNEEQTFREIVASDFDEGILSEADVASLRNLLARRSARKAAGRIGGRAAERLTGRLQAAQVEYAMIRSRDDVEPLVQRERLDVQRERIRAIRAELEALTGSRGQGAAAG